MVVMDDITSDQETFVSVDNFMTNAGPGPATGSAHEEAGVTDTFGIRPEDYLNEETGADGSSSSPPQDRSSFVWSMFNASRNSVSLDGSNGDSDTMSSRRQSEEGSASDSENEDSMTDASDLCVEIDDSHHGSGRPSQMTVRSVASPLQGQEVLQIDTPVIDEHVNERNPDLTSGQLSLPEGEQHTLLYAEEDAQSFRTEDGSYRTGEDDSEDVRNMQRSREAFVAALGSTQTAHTDGTTSISTSSLVRGPVDGTSGSEYSHPMHTDASPVQHSSHRPDRTSGVYDENTAHSSSGKIASSAQKHPTTRPVEATGGDNPGTGSAFAAHPQPDAGDLSHPSQLMQTEGVATACDSNHRRIEGTVDTKSVAEQTQNDVSGEDDSERLFQATSGMISFQVDNPFTSLSNDNATGPSKLTLFSRQGELSASEKASLEVLGMNTASSESVLVSKLIETIAFQREQMTQYKIAAAELGGTALHSESIRFSELERRRSIAMNALVTELDSERLRMDQLSQENEMLKSKVRELEQQLDSVTSYCRQFNPSFSFSGGVETALEAIFANAQDARRQSERHAAAHNNQLEELAARVMKLDGLLTDSRGRFEEVQFENLQLRRQLSVLEGASSEPARASPDASSCSPVDLDIVIRERDHLAQKIDEQNFQLDTLRQSLTRANEEKEKVDDALLALNIEVEMARSKANTLQSERDDAEKNCREVDQRRNAEKQKYHEMTQEFTDNIVAAVHDLDAKDVQIRVLKREMEDRESVVRSLQVTVSDLEGQLQTLTDAALDKGSSHRGSNGRSRRQVSTVLDTVVRNLRLDLEKAQSLLSKKSAELQGLKKKISEHDEVIVALRRECDHYRALASVKGRPAETLNVGNQEEQQNNFLNRLSSKLGVQSENNHELVGKLVSRVEQLMKDRSLHEASSEKLRREVLDRERKLHVVRSEMIAEITTLKAEVQHLENLNHRANEECRFAEQKLLEVLGERDNTRNDSIGDVTSSSLGLRRQSGIGEGDSQSRRESFFSVLGSDNTIQWNDPLVVAAVQSVNDLIEMKESLSSRVRALHEKFDRMIKRGDGVSGNEVRELMIESREIQGDLSGVVDMQQNIIDTLRPDRPGTSSSIPGAEDSLPYMRGSTLVDITQSDAGMMHTVSNNEAEEPSAEFVARSRAARNRDYPVSSVDDIGEAAGFLREQLKQTRDLYNEKSKANAQLCGVVAELRQDLDHVANEKRAAEDLIQELSETHESFVTRLSDITGTEKSVVAIEDFVRGIVHNLSTLSAELSAKNLRCSVLQHRAIRLLAQKRVLAYLVYTYQSKYQLDLLLPTSQEASSRKRRFRIAVFAVVASLRIGKLMSTITDSTEEIDISDRFKVPDLMPLVHRSSGSQPLVSASLAISAIPRLEAALVEKEKQIGELKSAIAALGEASARTPHEETRASLETSFAYNEDLLNRKDDLARKLRKAVKEKTDLEVQYSREREFRIATEAKLARYSERLTAAKKKLSRASAQADSKERTYKAAIKYLKQKADKALENRLNMDENANPWASPGLAENAKDAKLAKDDGRAANMKSLAVLQEQLARSEESIKGIESGSAEHEDMSKYIYGLRKAIQRLKHPRKSQTQGPSVIDSNLATDA